MWRATGGWAAGESPAVDVSGPDACGRKTQGELAWLAAIMNGQKSAARFPAVIRLVEGPQREGKEWAKDPRRWLRLLPARREHFAVARSLIAA
jgi:hypothetical protein